MKSANKNIIYTSIGLAFFVAAVYFIYSYTTNKNDPEEPYEPNQVNTDGFTYSFLKLETKKKNIIYPPL